ncbi:MAG: toxin [bacterium]|nr:toxin [bacterium]
MKNKFRWNPKKNILLEKTRGVSFEVIVALFETGKFTVRRHPTRPNQKIATLVLEGYPWDVSFVEEESGVFFLKTAYPNRKRK